MSREAVFALLANDMQLRALGITSDSVFTSNDVDTPSARPFVIVVFGASSRAFSTIATRDLTVWAHDNHGDYARIDAILDRVQLLMTEALNFGDDDYPILVQAAWTGDSDDLADDGYGTITRNSGFRLNTRKEVA